MGSHSSALTQICSPPLCLALQKNNGRRVHPSKGRRDLGYGAISPCPMECSEVETWQDWLAAGWSPVSESHQPVMVAVPSSVMYDLPLCFVAEHWQMRYCHSPVLGDPLWRGGERKGFTCLSSLSRWETTVQGVPKEKKERKDHLGRSGAMHPLLVPPLLPLNLPCPSLVTVVVCFWHSSAEYLVSDLGAER